jgi:hypothetical protein
LNLQVTVLKILVSYPDRFALVADLNRHVAILATSGPEWAERTKRLAARVPGLDIFSDGLVERQNGGWMITVKGRAVLESMEARRSEDPMVEKVAIEAAAAPVPGLPQPLERAKRLRECRQRRREARERARAHAS